MYTVISKNVNIECKDLALAMDYAKLLNEFVTIKGSKFEIVGRFGVDSIKDGLCPDGVAYTWMKRRKQ